MGNVDLPSAEFRNLLILIAGINTTMSFLFEKVFVERVLHSFIQRLAKPQLVKPCPTDDVNMKTSGVVYDWIFSRIGTESSWFTSRQTVS
ncbi:hypothetical protein DICVIV_01028 [Dictyocaulus viviparus]|uniref:Uncharacterized protein n=1 Tax=Dictyocaulus viviparus TaxID=29172 RepID=A0A0D8YDY1_DICVI|nr:hypothetical protein DICVIV_01028 [Dictyocaulus viviparus]